MNVQDVLLTSPDTIQRIEEELWNHRERRENARLRMKLRETDVAAAVAQAKDEKDPSKKRYPNEAAREGEVRRLLFNDAAYNDARREDVDEANITARVERVLERERNRFRAALALSRATGNLDLEFPEDRA